MLDGRTMNHLPTGTITFLFTDVEGSTRLVQELGERWPAVLSDHDTLIGDAVAGRRGTVVRTEGDAVFAVFPSAVDAVTAAVAAQRAIAAHPWPEDGVIRVRMGMHTGLGTLGGSDYVGIDVHRAARVAASGHGGQIVLSEATAPLVERMLPDGTELVDLGKHRLKDLSEAETLFQVSVAGIETAFPPLNTLERVTHNLPVQVTSFVGREREIAEAIRLLEGTRILTLLGPGGTGKTRLALQVAAEASDRFRDGVYFVGLAEIADPGLIPSTVLDALGVAPAGGTRPPGERLNGLLATRSVLLVLDNFEHLVEAAGVVSALARSSPASKFLVTSRIPLRVSGEQEMPISPLAVGDDLDLADHVSIAQVEAVRLFLERAAAVRPEFMITPDNAAAVAALVRRLDGLPLAIELVVPRLRLLSVEAILERLDTRTLGGGTRDLPERHRTLWSAISWSDESLEPRHRALLCRLGVFAGGARLEEIEVVVAACDPGTDVLEGLAALVESSLLRRVEGTADRFEMLTVIREYASDRLDASGGRVLVEGAHAAAYLNLAERAAPHLLGRERKRWLEVLTTDHDNLRAALTYLTDHGAVDQALRLAWALWRFWQIKGHTYEARQRIDAVLALEGGDPRLLAKAIEASGGIAWWQGDLLRAHREYGEALTLQRSGGDSAELANALYNFGLAQAFAGADSAGSNTVENEAAFQEAEEIYLRLGDQRGLGDVHWGMGNVAVIGKNDPEAALGFFETAVVEYGAAGSVFGEGWAYFEMGQVMLRLGRLDDAESALSKGLELMYGSGDESAVVLFVIIFAAVAAARGDLPRAHRLAGSAWALRDRSGLDIISIPEIQVEGLEREALEALTGSDAAAYREGLKLTAAQAVAYALVG